MKRTFFHLMIATIAAAACLAAARGWAADEPGDKPATAASPDKASARAELEKKFSESLSGATLDGYFTETPGDESKPRESKYVLNKVSKIKDDLWLFDAQIKYGEHDVTVPIPLVVHWAGDTPVITLDKVGVPGFGTFTRSGAHLRQYVRRHVERREPSRRTLRTRRERHQSEALARERHADRRYQPDRRRLDAQNAGA